MTWQMKSTVNMTRWFILAGAQVDPVIRRVAKAHESNSVHLKSGTMFLGHEGTGCPAAHRELPQADSTGGDAGIDVPAPGTQWMHG